MVVFLPVLRRQQRRPRAKNAISRENLQMRCLFLRSRLLSGDGSVDDVKHELFAHRVEGAEILYPKFGSWMTRIAVWGIGNLHLTNPI